MRAAEGSTMRDRVPRRRGTAGSARGSSGLPGPANGGGHRRLMAALLAGLALLVAVACTPPAGDPGRAPEGVTTAAPPAPLDVSVVPGLESSTESSTDPDRPVAISTVVAPGLDALNAMTTTFVDGWRPASDGAERTRIDVGWDVMLAARSMIAVRMHAQGTSEAGTGVAGQPERAAAIYYADVVRGSAWSGRDLFTPEGADAVVALVAGAEIAHTDSATPGLTTPGLGPSPTDAPPTDGAGAADRPGGDMLADVAFDARGDLLVTRPDADGWHAWKVPSAVVTPLLSEAGRAVRGTVRTAGTFVGRPGPPHGPEAVPMSVPLVPPPRPPDPPGGPDCTRLQCVALTFDDGPGPHTQRLLDELAAVDVPATFFLVGQNAASRPELVAAIAAAGHEIGNHTWNHPDLTALDAAGIRDQLDRTATAIRDAAGVGAPLVRPPYGAIDDAARAVLELRGSPAILWSVDTQDWRNRDAEETTRRAVEQAEAGAVILLHDIHPTSVDAVPGIVETLQAEGYTFVTVSQLFRGQDLVPGEEYSQR